MSGRRDDHLEIGDAPIDDPRVEALLRRHAEGMLEHSPPGACHFLDLDGMRDPSVTLWGVWDGNDLAGIGALRQLDPQSGELKSMRTDDRHLGRGIGRLLLDHILERARTREYSWVALETGSTDGFAAACHLYESAGFERCGPFGDYEDNEFSRFYRLDLAATEPG